MAKSNSERASAARERLVGRDRELSSLRTAIDQGARLVTVTGAFGVGKSALVREAVRAGLTRDGEHVDVALVDLADAKGREALLDAVAEALGRAGRTARGATARSLALAGPLVLVLDPFDRLTDAKLSLLDWLHEAPELSIVAVSRERLSVPGEQLVEVAPLSIADGVALLEVLGARHRGTFTPNEAERAALASVAERLDGIPLALELAAPRLAVMAPQALLYRLENRWKVLRREGDGRHATLEASVGWSLELLEPGPRDVLTALTIFHGGLTIDAAEAVIPAPAAVLDALQSLRARSLVAAEEDPSTGELRLTLLSSVRDLAARELTPERAKILRDRHATYYVELAEREARAAEERGLSRARETLARERENLLAVVRSILGVGVVSTQEADRALRALCAVGPSLLVTGAGEELARDLELALSVARGSGADPRLIARALLLRAEVLDARADRTGSERDLAEALVLSHHAGDGALEARVLLAASASAVLAGDASRAATAVARARELGGRSLEPHLATRALWLEGAIAERGGDAIGARLAYEECRARARALDLPHSELDAARSLALLDLREGASDAVTARVAEGRPVAARLRHARGDAQLVALGAAAAQLRGELAHALSDHDQATRVAREAALDSDLPWLAGLAAIARAEAGERGEARAGLAEARLDAGAMDPDFALLFSIARARLARSAGRTSEADEERSASRAIGARARDRGLVMLAETDVAPDTTSGLVALALRVPLTSTSAPSMPPEAAVLRIGPQGTWFRAPGGARVDLSRRKPLRLILERLADERERGPAALPWDALLEAGWPGEKMRADAGAHRVRVAISTMRKMGLADALRTGEMGYLLDMPIERAR